MADPVCSARGVPEHLHHVNRPVLSFDEAGEKLFRRYNPQTSATVTACIDFRRMSVNRGRLSQSDEVLLDTEGNGGYPTLGVVAFEVGDLRSAEDDGKWRVPNVPGNFELRPVHGPLQCNYAHTEVVAYKDGVPQPDIKPTTVKLAIRQHLKTRLQVLLPLDRAGKQMPLKA